MRLLTKTIAVTDLVELNVQEQCINILKDPSVQEAIISTGYPQLHGLAFNFNTGLLKDLNINFEEKLVGIQEIYNLKDAEWHAFNKK